jgi:hypothetical protein
MSAAKLKKLGAALWARTGQGVYLLLVIAVAFNLYFLWPEVHTSTTPLNDGVLHLTNLERALSAVAQRQDLTDHWQANIGLGYPLLHYYQHLPYVIPALLEFILLLWLRSAPPPLALLNWSTYLLLSLFPLAVYWSMRRLGFGRAQAVGAALCSSLLSTNGLYGFDFESYVWGGYGLYTQLWGMCLLPPALAQGYSALKTGRGYFLAVLLLSGLLLSHLMLGYIGLGSLVMIAVVVAMGTERSPGAWRLAGRLALLLGLSALVTAYLFVPFLRDGAYLNRSVWEAAHKYNSFGLQWTLTALVEGRLFDANRLPILTLLAGLGLLVCLRRWREEVWRIPALLFVVWLVLYFGRPTWGALLDLLPLGGDLQLHRFIAGVHLAGIMLMGIGLGALWGWVSRLRVSVLQRSALLWPATAALVTLALLAPAYVERGAYLRQSAQWKSQAALAGAVEEQNLQALFADLRSLPPGRVYAGLGANWGKDYRIGSVPMYGRLQLEGLDMVGYMYHALSLNSDVEVWFDETHAEQYDLFNVRYVVAPADHPFPAFAKLIGSYGRHRLYTVQTSGYFDLVATGPGFAGDKSEWYPAAEAWLHSSLPRETLFPVVYLEWSATGTPTQPLSQAAAFSKGQRAGPFLPAGQIVSEAVQSDAYGAHVTVERAGTLLLKITYHPNWHAYVDGVETPTEMLMPSYIGVPVTPGSHTVWLRYRPQAYRGWLLWLGLVTLAALGLAEWQVSALAGRSRLALRRSVTAVAGQPTPGSVTPAEQAGSQRAGGLRHALRRSVTAVAGRRAPGAQTPAERRGQPVPGNHSLLGLYLLLLGIYLASTAGHFWSTDHVSVYMTTRSLVERGSLAIEHINDTLQGPDGSYYGVFGLGQSLVTIPLYLLGRAVDALASPGLRHFFAGPAQSYWGGTVPIYFVNLFNAFFTPLSCVVLYLFALRLGFPRRAALLTSLLFGLCTAAWVGAQEFFQHPLETLLLLSTIYVLYANRESLNARLALAAGALLGLGVLTRINLVFSLPLVGAYLCYYRITAETRRTQSPHRGLRIGRWTVGPDEETLRCLVIFATPTLLVLSGLLYLNAYRYGDAFAFNRTVTAHGFTLGNLPQGLYGNLLSPGRSLFLYSPPVLLGVWYCRRFLREHRPEGLLFAALSAVYLLFYAGYGDWMGGWSWGPRFLLAVVPYLVLPAAYAFENKWPARAAAALALLGAEVQIAGVTVSVSYVYWDWIGMKLNPPDAFLFIPTLSAIPTHGADLLAGRNLDLWLLWVLQQFGAHVFVLTLAVPVALAWAGWRLIRPVRDTVSAADCA